jgi:hypothetical protein
MVHLEAQSSTSYISIDPLLRISLALAQSPPLYREHFFNGFADFIFLQQTMDQAALIASLRAELESATSVSSTAPKTLEPDTDVESDSRLHEAFAQKANLERELQLMASAWYDQNSRLMSDTVSMSMSRGRPPPEPRSFLGRQRKAVDIVLTGRG